MYIPDIDKIRVGIPRSVFCAFASQLLTTLRVFSHVDLCTSFWKEDGDGERNERREGTFAEAQVLLNR